MARSRKKQNPPKGSPLWMTTFSDMVTLVLTFFILLFSFSNLDALKWQQVVASVRGSLGVLDGGTTLNDSELIKEGVIHDNYRQITVSENVFLALQNLQEEIAQLEEQKEYLSRILLALDERIIVDIDERGVVLRFQDRVLFEKAKADIRPEARQVLIKLAEILKEVENPIRIEGHTDDLAINTPQFPSNWELSTARATNVLRLLIEQDLNPQQLSAVGYGEYHPLVPNINEAARQQNRRVDIVLLKKDSVREAMLSGVEIHGE
jgi:chemotaxis protein MotB